MIDNCLQIRDALLNENPNDWIQRRVEWATNPLAPTSIVMKTYFHPAADIAGVRSLLYRRFFLRTAAGIPSSAPHVNSNSITRDVLTDQMTMSGLSLDAVIPGGIKWAHVDSL